MHHDPDERPEAEAILEMLDDLASQGKFFGKICMHIQDRMSLGFNQNVSEAQKAIEIIKMAWTPCLFLGKFTCRSRSMVSC